MFTIQQEPDMSKPFRDLATEFNATAKAYLTGEVSIELLTTKYSVLLSHKASEPEEKAQLVGTLYDCGLKWLQSLSQPGKSVDNQTLSTMLSLFSRLTEDDGIQMIPRSAPEQLTDAALELISRAEGPDGGSSSTKTYTVRLAAQTLAAADKIKAAHEQAVVAVSTSQDITASKKIELKPKDGFAL